jgi:hypothetical protein
LLIILEARVFVSAVDSHRSTHIPSNQDIFDSPNRWPLPPTVGELESGLQRTTVAMIDTSDHGGPTMTFFASKMLDIIYCPAPIIGVHELIRYY